MSYEDGKDFNKLLMEDKIGLGMLFNLFFAGLSGASIPLLMKSIGIDPAQSSSIILTTVTDVLGFVAFLGFAVLFQRFLV